MQTYASKKKENQSKLESNFSPTQSSNTSAFQFVDNRRKATSQRKMQEVANHSQRTRKIAQLQVRANDYAAPQPIQKKANKTGLPDKLKTGVESLSGYSMDDVKVHYNSDKPAQLNAHAYAQGTDIHVAAGQEKHLPHEAWHVVQQKQGRVKPTMQMRDKVNVNDDAGLEKEADVMGTRALQRMVNTGSTPALNNTVTSTKIQKKQVNQPPNNSSFVLQMQPGGTMIGRSMRALINSFADKFGGINDRPHYYVTEKVSFGKGNPKLVYNELKNAPVILTVPGAIKSSGKRFGNRKENGTATAMIGGDVKTVSDDAKLTITNITLPGHLFKGKIVQKFWLENGQVMSQIEGSGDGNFAYLNEQGGRIIFTYLLKMQANFYNKS